LDPVSNNGCHGLPCSLDSNGQQVKHFEKTFYSLLSNGYFKSGELITINFREVKGLSVRLFLSQFLPWASIMDFTQCLAYISDDSIISKK
jgi:hypothetical protein